MALIIFISSVFVSWKISRHLVDIMNSESSIFFSLIWTSRDKQRFEWYHIKNWVLIEASLMLISLVIGHYLGELSSEYYIFMITVLCPFNFIFLEVVKSLFE
jgi:hypothetical protein